jgi:succinate dehydrogenase flavin-adding protein (antitoxin of CptAB toxin-antitoxin module)
MGRRITIRVDNNLYDFLQTFADMNGQTVSEMIRDVLKYFSMRLLLGHFRDKSYEQVKEEYLKNLDKIPELYKQEFFQEIVNKKALKKKNK